MNENPTEARRPPPDVLVTGVFNETTGYAIRRAHGSGNWLVTYTLDGQGLYRHQGAEILTKAGDLVLLQPGAPHDYSVPDEKHWRFIWAHFHPRLDWFSWLPLDAAQCGLWKVSIRTQQERDRAMRALFRLHEDSQAPGNMQSELALNDLEEALLVAVKASRSTGHRPMDPRIQQVLAVITRDLGAQHSIESLAEGVGLSPSRLAHLFKEQVGDSVTNTIIMLRMRQATKLLEYTVESITDISEQLDFSSPFYFSRQFHQRYGVSPSEYRETVLRNSAVIEPRQKPEIAPEGQE